MLSLLTATVVALTAIQQGSLTDEADVATHGDVSGNPLVYSGRAGSLAITIPRVEDPNITIDGRLDDPVWKSAAVLTDFTQYEPVEGIPSTEETQVRVFYSGDAIYFAIRAWDSEPDLILARLGERDRAVFTDDWIRIMLDTFDDQRQAYVFYVNPLGIQVDGLWIEGMRSRFGRRSAVSIDFNPDFIWESDGRVIADGWTAEMKIPYASLRFREVSVQDWGLSVSRGVRRKEFKQSWAPLTQDVSSTLAQAGKLVGLRDIKPRKLVEINPVATGIRRGQ
ncbi:MAG: carbohydrate binding family 9 domain-containing protein, partial [Gammaproteobacteria bacterium]|nr:carbohydrate binding family 9 domain-containing protein [Gammaproteobacteria bacterium]